MTGFDDFEDDVMEEDDESDDLYDEDEYDESADPNDYEDELKEMINGIARQDFGIDLEDYEDAVDEIAYRFDDVLKEYLLENDVSNIEEMLEDEEVQSLAAESIREYLEDNYIDFPDLRNEEKSFEESPVFLGAFGSMLERFDKPDKKKGSPFKDDYDKRIDDFIDDMEGFAHEYRDDFDSLSEAMDYFEDELEIKNRTK